MDNLLQFKHKFTQIIRRQEARIRTYKYTNTDTNILSLLSVFEFL